MSLVIEIAGMSVLLKAPGFMKGLSEKEKKMLKPFIKRDKINARRKKEMFLFNGKSIRPARQLVDFSAREKIKAFFPDNIHERFGILFNNFIERYFFTYLGINMNARKRAMRLLEHNGDYNKITIGYRAFLLFNGKSRKGEIVYKNIKTPNDEDPFNSYKLKLLFKTLLTYKEDGFLIHASSIENNDSGYVFIGRGGSGKSTVAGLLRPDRVLCDDVSIIRKANDSYRIFSNPWWNIDADVKMSDVERPADLKAAFFIKKSGRTGMRRLAYKEALKRLLYGDIPFHQLVGIDNKTAIRNFYVFSQSFVKEVPIFELKIKKGKEFKEQFNRLSVRYLKGRL